MGSQEDLSALLESLKPPVKNLVGDYPDFEGTWRSVIEKYLAWFSESAEKITGLARNLALLESLSHAYGFDLRGDKEIADIIISEAPSPGQDFCKMENSGSEVTYRVIDRQITPTCGILLFLESKAGEVITEEIYE
jgi:hypothetical protein